MTLFKISEQNLEPVAQTTFAKEGMLERQHLQQLLRANISVLGDDLMVLAEEFGNWQDSNRRIDLLCLDRKGHIVVVEIKRTEDGGYMDLQAIRYAAMASSMTLEDLIDAHSRFLGGEHPDVNARAAVLEFLDEDPDEAVGQIDGVRIILVSADFSTELTTSVLWLNKHDIEVTCIKIKPYRLLDNVLLDVAQIIPLPEAADYEVRQREKAQENRTLLTGRQEIFRRFWVQLIERSKPKTQLWANRRTSSDHWLSAGIGRSGFGLSLTLAKDRASVDCNIRIESDIDKSKSAFNALLAQKQKVEKDYGGDLEWHELPNKIGCRISSPLAGGWQIPESEWAELQYRLINAAIRLHTALKGPIQSVII